MGTTKNETKRPRGRRQKLKRGCCNGGRKRLDSVIGASKRTRLRRAKELLEYFKYDLDLLKEKTTEVVEFVKNDLDLIDLAVKIGKLL